MTYGELVREAIAKAQREAEEKKDACTVIEDNEDGTQTITTFYKKGKAIWERMQTGDFVTESRVYKVNSDAPYVRWIGHYFYITGEYLEAMKAAM